MTKYFATSFILLALVLTPVTSQAQSAVYNTMTTNEKIAFLYGMIAQLQIILEMRIETESDSSNVFSTRDRSDIDVETRSATDVEEDEAELRAEIDLNGEDEARVWFEYGERSNDLDEDTSKRRITDSRGDEVDVSVTIDDLDEDERYYFRAVAEDEDGDRSYGSVRNFTTDDDGGSSSSNSDDFELEVSDTTIEEGDEVEVDWEIPSDEEGSQNWIGLYEVGEDNRDFVEWEYIDDDDSGSMTFEIDDRGEYEFRLFLNNSYDDEITSDEIEVE